VVLAGRKNGQEGGGGAASQAIAWGILTKMSTSEGLCLGGLRLETVGVDEGEVADDQVNQKKKSTTGKGGAVKPGVNNRIKAKEKQPVRLNGAFNNPNPRRQKERGRKNRKKFYNKGGCCCGGSKKTQGGGGRGKGPKARQKPVVRNGPSKRTGRLGYQRKRA